MPKQMICPRCASADLFKLPPNQITKNPGYTCNQCQLSMRHSSSVLVPLAILIVALSVLAFTLLPWLGVIEGGRMFIFLPFIALAVAGYSLQQMFLPAPRAVDEDSSV